MSWQTSFGALKPRMKSHYRGHKMAVWLNLIPQLHQPGDDDVSMRHHHFHEREQHYYAGAVRPESFTRLPPPLHPASITDQRRLNSGSGSTECVPTNELEGIDDDDTSLITDDDTSDDVQDDDEDAQLLERLATRHYYSYTAALGVTVGVGCLLLLLNMLIFAGIYYQRGRDRRKRQNHNNLHMSSSSENIPMQQRSVLNNQSTQQPQSPTTLGAHVIKVHEPPPCYATVNKNTNNTNQLPEHPPPPPKKTKSKNCEKPKPPLRTSSVPPLSAASSAPNSPTTNVMTDMGTNTIKKRVQIQEISV